MSAKSVSDLAGAVQVYLRGRGHRSPGRSALKCLLETVYLASLKTEEGSPLQMRLVLVDPENPDPDPPSRPRASRWSIIPLSARIPLTVPNLIKLSRAADPWSSSLAVFYKQDGIFFIWGLVDQTVHFNTMLVRETTSGYAPPGLFQVVATGTADLTVYREYRFVGRLAQDTLVTSQNDVFELGPIRERLFDGIERYWDAVLRRIRALQPVDGDDVAYLGDRWVGTLCRLLISIQRYRHGGALLIGTSRSGLDVKYAIDYGRLSAALTNLGVATIVRARTADHISDVYLDKDKNSLPVDLYLDEAMAQDDADDLEQEITGCVRFISSLSCVDGAILATPELRIRGFGVEILTKKDAEAVYLSLKPNVHPKSVRAVDPNHYGMRHRSMMRYCFWHPRSLGFVVSQDGEIRAMTRVEDRLVMWENLQVHWLWESRRSRVQSGGRSGAAPTG